MSLQIGVMQGRLSPPQRHSIQEFPDAWEREFPLAAALGFDAIEFIFGGPPETLRAHPLLEPGVEAIRRQTASTGVAVTSVCADHFMEAPLHRGGKEDRERRLGLLRQLIVQAGQLGVTDIVLPCVDAATLRGSKEQDLLVAAMERLVPDCTRCGVRLALELDLPPPSVRTLLERCGTPWIRVNFDIGNSAALGYNPVEEWDAYGAWVSSVHVKDRLRGGGTVPLGTGAAQFDRFFERARRVGYDGLFTIQGARGTDHAATAAGYRKFVEALITTHYGVDAYRPQVAR